MSEEVLHIKNMVCNRCIRVVDEELTKLGHTIKAIELGTVELANSLRDDEFETIREVLQKNGFELLTDKTSRLISKIKLEIINVVHYDGVIPENTKFSEYLSRKLAHDYSYLSNLFSSIEGVTIEKYLILQKIEKAKELLVYDELTLNEIAYQLGYNSVQYLSAQFKKITGLTPTHFKKVQQKKRLSLDIVSDQKVNR